MTNISFRGSAALMVAAIIGMMTSSCDKVSPTGVLVGTTSVDDRVKMSLQVYQDTYDSRLDVKDPQGEYSFLVGSDSHLTTDPGRMDEMQSLFLEHGDLFMAHLGDIADTKAEYYMTLAHSMERGKDNYIARNFHPLYDDDSQLYLANRDLDKLIEAGEISAYADVDDMDFADLVALFDRFGVDMLTDDDIQYPFFPVVGNHDITHDGWALFTTIFRSSTYEFTVKVAEGWYDQYIFLDSANGTLGKIQIDAIEDGMLRTHGINVRHTFVFTHTNVFRPSSNEFASTYAREEGYYILKKLADWNTTIAFYGHVHKWDDRWFGGVRHLTLDSMSEANSPDAGDYLVRVTCHADGNLSVERVRMNYVAR